MTIPMNQVSVDVTISKNPLGIGYSWTFKSDYKGFDSKTGKVTLQDLGPTQITYNLLSPEYSLIYANLDPSTCATREIHTMQVDVASNSIILTDINSKGLTGTDDISIQLIARVKGSTSDPIISPDPEVVNDPPITGGGHHHHHH